MNRSVESQCRVNLNESAFDQVPIQGDLQRSHDKRLEKLSEQS